MRQPFFVPFLSTCSIALHYVTRHYCGSVEDVIRQRAVFYRFLISPMLVHLKPADNLQTVNRLYQGWRGVARQNPSFRMRGCMQQKSRNQKYCAKLHCRNKQRCLSSVEILHAHAWVHIYNVLLSLIILKQIIYYAVRKSSEKTFKKNQKNFAKTVDEKRRL